MLRFELNNNNNIVSEFSLNYHIINNMTYINVIMQLDVNYVRFKTFEN